MSGQRLTVEERQWLWSTIKSKPQDQGVVEAVCIPRPFSFVRFPNSFSLSVVFVFVCSRFLFCLLFVIAACLLACSSSSCCASAVRHIFIHFICTYGRRQSERLSRAEHCKHLRMRRIAWWRAPGRWWTRSLRTPFTSLECEPLVGTCCSGTISTVPLLALSPHMLLQSSAMRWPAAFRLILKYAAYSCGLFPLGCSVGFIFAILFCSSCCMDV